MPATHTRLRTPGQPNEPQALARLRREFDAKHRRLRETLLNLDNLISPADWLDAGDGFPGFGAWRWNRPGTRAQDHTHAPISYLNEEEWRQHVALARDLVTRNHLALGFRDHVANFVGPVSISFVLKGQAPGASASGPIDADGDGEPDIDPIVKEATQVWDEWRELAEWGEGEHDRESECRTRLIVEGECTLRFFTGTADSNGLPHVRHVEPELIRTPPGHDTTDSWGWGIKCAEDDDECEDALWLCRPDNPNEGREVRSSEYVRAKANVDRTVKRGLSDFFAVAEHLRKVLGLLDNMGHVARLQSAIAWWEQYPTATEAQVRAMIQSGTDYSRPKVAPGAPTRTSDVQNYEPGSIIRTEAGRQVQPGPVATGVAGYAQVEALLLRGVGFRWGCPSYFSGDADASFASVLVTGSPFVRITEARQEKVKGFARAVARRVLEFCERTGRLPRGTTQRVRPIATARPVVIADEEKQARTFLSLYQQKCADPIEFVRKRGGDPKVVAANILAWQKKFAPPDQPPGGGAGPSGPFPSPPGSAGGDGTSPNAPPVGEARRVRENQSGAGKNEGEVWQGPSGHWFTLKNGHVVPAKDPNATPNPNSTGGSAQQQGTAANANSTASTPGKAAGGLAKLGLKDLLGKQSDEEAKLKALGAAQASIPDKAEAATSVLLPGATWQISGNKAVPVGDGFDFRKDDGAVLRLLDTKTRESESAVTITDGERLSKIGETLQAIETGKSVVSGYLHIHKTTGATFATGFAPGEAKYTVGDPPPQPQPQTTTTKKKKRKSQAASAPPKPKILFSDINEWKTAVQTRLNANDRDAPIPALQLSPALTTDFGQWHPADITSARDKYDAAVAFLTHPDNYEKYKQVITNQSRARIVTDAQTALKAAGNKPEVIVDLLTPYLKNNHILAQELAKVEELEKAVYANATPEKLAQAASGMSSEHKAEVAKQITTGMSDEQFKQFVEEEMKRRAAGSNSPPTT